jgi:LysR family transcriptional regulator for metE and metH
MRPRLDTRHLEMILALSEESSVADAARTLRVTPSALSHRIREAERRLGVALYQKRGRGLQPTVAGDILAHAAERLLASLAQSERAAVASTAGVRHLIRLTVGIYNSFHWLPRFLPGFRKAHPEIDIDIEADAVLSPFEKLAAESIDLVISQNVIMPATFDLVPLFTDELVAVSPPGHHFGGRAYLLPEDFLEETNLTYSMVRQPGFESDRFWSRSDVHPAHEAKIGSVEAICELVKAGLGVSILSRWALKPHFEAGTLQATRLGPEGVEVGWSAVMRKTAGDAAPERLIARALAGWFGKDPPLPTA